MSVHTYVGARYIPRFVGTYDPTQIYEALDVVDNGSGTSYIARKTVPAGTPLTDTTYWFVYGAASGAIIALQNDMITAQNDIISLQGDMTGAQNDITQIQKDISVKYLIITDSYGLSVNSSSQTFIEVAEGLTGLTLDSESTSSGGFGGGVKVKDGLVNYTGDRSAITDIIVVCGANDVNTGLTFTDIYNGIVDFDTYAKSEYPNAKIHLLGVGTCYQAAATYSADARMGMMEAYISTAKALAWAVPESSFYLLHDNRYLQADLLHPNANGVDEIGRLLAQYINGRTFTFLHRNYHTDFNTYGSNITTVSLKFDELMCDNDYMWYRNDASLAMMSATFTTPLALSGGVSDWVELGTLSARMIDTFSSNNKYLIQIPVMLTHSDSTRSFGSGLLSIQFGKFYIKFATDKDTSISSFMSYTDCIHPPKM